MILRQALFLFLCLWAGHLFSQHTLSGYIYDESTGESLISASIYVNQANKGTVSNVYGFYSYTSEEEVKTDLTVSYIGYQDKVISFDFSRDSSINIYLTPSVELTEIEIIAEREVDSPENVQMSQIVVPIAQIKTSPALLGEVDVIKTLQLLPGVQSGAEGFSGLYVRGGSPDQNLIMLDGVPLYNVSHLFGIFSVFNADALKNVRLIKGGFPAEFGGRLSSVVDIRMKEGNLKKIEGEGSIGLISSKLTLQGPLIKDKTSFLVSGRRTYVDLIANPFIKNSGENVEDFNLFFHDINAKLQHIINDRHKLYLSGYFGVDRFGIGIDEEDFASTNSLGWNNTIGSFRWNWKISDKLFSNTSLNYSQYDLNIFSGFTDRDVNSGNDDAAFSAAYVSGIEDITWKTDVDYVLNPQHYIKFGASATRHRYSPGALALDFEAEQFQLDTLLGTSDQQSLEYYAYVQDEISFGKLKANVGLHFSGFNIESTNYTSLQPRLSLRYLVNDDLSIKASYAQMSQFVNLLTTESLSLPFDLWVPSTERIEPQRSWQVAAGVSQKLGSHLNLSIEGFYKELDNVLSFEEGASFLLRLDGDWQDQVTQGRGETYGLEVLLQKKQGDLTGWIGYTWAKNNRQFDEINFGRPFPFRYDRRHDLSLVLSYKLNDRISLSGNWSFGTGNAITVPEFLVPTEVFPNFNGNFLFNDVPAINEKNNFRLSNFHRLDLGVSFRKKTKWGERTWVIGLYNAYSHSNPFYAFINRTTEVDGFGRESVRRSLNEVSILPVIPSVSYNFKF